MKEYAQAVCGGIDNVKKLYVLELRRKRLEKNLTCEELDSMLNFGPEWPTIREMERNPLLFTLNFQQRLIMRSLDNSKFEKTLFCLTGEGISEKIVEYIQDLQHLQDALADFHASTRIIHGTIWSEDMGRYLRKILDGEPVQEFRHNMISPQSYASIHIESCIMSEVLAADLAPIV